MGLSAYDFLGYGHDKPVKISNFLKSLPLAITRLLALYLVGPDRKRDVDITLDNKAKTAKTFKESLD